MKYLIKIIDKIDNKALMKQKRKNISRILLKDLLYSNYGIINYKLFTNEYGKYFIKDKNIFFSVSYSYQCVVCVVDDYEIGIDVEKIRKTNINTINLFATDNEKMYILEDDTYKRLFEIFTLKEAYFKMLGTDLSEMKKIEFRINNDTISCSDNSVICEIIYVRDYIISIVKKISN